MFLDTTFLTTAGKSSEASLPLATIWMIRFMASSFRESFEESNMTLRSSCLRKNNKTVVKYGSGVSKG